MKSVSFTIGLFVFFTTILLSMMWIIEFQVQSDSFLYATKQLHRTMSTQCIAQGCSKSQLANWIHSELRYFFPTNTTNYIEIPTLHFEPFILEMDIAIEIPAPVKPLKFTYSKIMIEVKR